MCTSNQLKLLGVLRRSEKIVTMFTVEDLKKVKGFY